MLSHVFTPVVVTWGLSCLVSQLVLFGLSAYVLPKGPWSELPGFTAHQVVCFPLMIYLTYQGMSIWFFDSNDNDSLEDTASSHILEVHEGGKHMAQVVLGMMLFWDIPVGLVTNDLFDYLMIVHHFGMAFIAGVATGVFSNGHALATYYSAFFLGLVEISSIFLVVVDLFHPKHKAWYNYLKSGDTRLKQGLRNLNQFVRVTFAVCFLAVRAIYFPYVQATSAMPDFYRVASMSEDEKPKHVSSAILYTVCILATLFSILQMYWGMFVARQVVKALGLLPDKKDKKE